MSEERKRTPLEMFLLIVSIISAIAFLAKIFGRGEEQERKATRSRRELYGKVKPTYPDYRYKNYAEVLDKALMKDSTEDEEAVYNVFNRMKNVSDIEKLIEAFGTKRQMFSTHYITLPQAMQYLSKGEKNKLNAIIASNGIDYTFE